MEVEVGGNGDNDPFTKIELSYIHEKISSLNGNVRNDEKLHVDLPFYNSLGVFTKCTQHENASIANFVLAILLEKRWTNEFFIFYMQSFCSY